MSILIVAGTRYPDPKNQDIISRIESFNEKAIVHISNSIQLIGEENLKLIISGKCKNSPDMLIRVFNSYFDPDESWFPADWSIGRSAGPIRNAKMAEKGTHLLAFWDGESSGTKNMIHEAEKRNLHVRVVRFDYKKTFGTEK